MTPVVRAALPLLLSLTASPVIAQGGGPAAVSDPELAAITGKFVLSNGAEIALSVVSDAVVDGRAVLRTVLTVDRGTDLRVYARPAGGEAGQGVAVTPAGAAHAQAAGQAGAPAVSVLFDRQSGARLTAPAGVGVGPTLAVSTGAAGRDAGAEAAARGLTQVTLVPGGPAVATADGQVSLNQLANGSAVALAGDRLGVVQLVGRTIATAAINSADNRVIDTVTDVGIDLRNVQPFTTATAMMRADALALEATGRMVR